MSSGSNPEKKLTEEKNQIFKEDNNIEKISEFILNIFNMEYAEIFQDILLLSKETFLNNIKKNIFDKLQKMYTEKIKENKDYRILIENNFKKLEEKYDYDYNIIKNNLPKEENKNAINYLNNYLKHCFYDNEYANHNCEANSKFIKIYDKNNNIVFVICNNCNKVYLTSFILCKCFYCNKEYYSEILNQEKDNYLFPATWKKYHCKKILNDIIPCIKCQSQLNLNIKTGKLICSNKECDFISEPKDIVYSCNICNSKFNSEVIIYNPLNKEIIRKIINQTLLIKNKAFPKQKQIPCCGLNIDISIEFYHSINCKGILYLGKINEDLIIICGKCQAINYYEKFIWTCPKCKCRFREEDNNINKDIKEDNEDFVLGREKEIDKVIIIDKESEKKKSIKRKYKSFRLRKENDDNERKKISVNLLSIDVMKKNNSNISKIKLYEKNYYNSTNEVSARKPKKFSLYKSNKGDIKKFKIPLNFAKIEISKKENKNTLNIINTNETQKEKNEIQLELKTKPLNNINFDKIKIDDSNFRKGRKSVYQYYKNLKSKKNVTENLPKENKENIEKNKETIIKDNNNNKRSFKKFYFDRIKVRRKTMNNPEVKININNKDKLIKEKEEINPELKKDKKEIKEFISHLNLEGDKIIEKEEEKEYTKNTENEAKHINSTEDSNSSYTKSIKIVSKIPGMSDDLYSQIIQQINTILSSCKIPRFNLEDYQINRKIGEGSYGIIHSLINNKTNEQFALKKIIAQSIQKVSEFVKEFELVNICQHSNILKIYGLNINLLDHSTYSIQVLMEKAERDWNRDIKRRAQEEKYYTEKELLSIMKQLTLALLYMKEKLNIAHRDIKPQNVLIFKNGIFKLADFGEAKEIKINKNLNTLRGTELYMSPALYNGLKINKDDIEHDPFKSDLFSLGFCFIYAATMDFNLLYYLRNIDNDIEIKKKLRENLNNKYSEKFIRIITRMVELDENKRCDFKELNEEIDRILENNL